MENKLEIETFAKDMFQRGLISNRLKSCLMFASVKYRYMDQLSVIKLAKIRNVGQKSIKELLHVYPDLEKEVKNITTKEITDYIKINQTCLQEYAVNELENYDKEINDLAISLINKLCPMPILQITDMLRGFILINESIQKTITDIKNSPHF
jgi:hypothetical protein